MNNSGVITNTLRFLGLGLMQVLVLKNIAIGGASFDYIQILIYPLFIFLLPLRIPTPLLIGLSFFIGISIDMFYDSPGIHASASVFTAFIRPYVLSILEPRSGYTVTDTPTKRHMGFSWFVQYAAILLFLHLFFYFSVEVFTFVYFGKILLKTIFSFIFSMFFIIIYQYIFDPSK